jgi:hypothetical protein
MASKLDEFAQRALGYSHGDGAVQKWKELGLLELRY